MTNAISDDRMNELMREAQQSANSTAARDFERDFGHGFRILNELCDLQEAGRTSDLIAALARLRDSDNAADREAYQDFKDNNAYKWFDFEQAGQ